MTGLVDDRPVFLSTLTAQRSQSRLALAVTVVSAALFLLMVPFAKQPLAPVWGFIPIYESALVVSDLITAALLFGQFAILRSRALLVLAGGYLFTACLAAVHAMTFPGLFAPNGLLGAGAQTTAWLYMLWHAGFPLAVLIHVGQMRRPPEAALWRGSTASAVLGCVALVLALTVGCGLLTTVGREALPGIMQGNRYTPAMIFVVGSVWLLSAVALVALWRQQPRTVLGLWLMVVMCAWLFDIGLSAVFNAGRFDLGFYAGRIYGLLAANFVLIVLMLENSRLYAGLVDAHARERQKSADLQRLNARLDDSNHQLEQASRFKSEFLANMAHELRTPLNAVIGFSELLKDEQVGRLLDKQKRFASLIFDSGHHLLSLINDILDLSKVEAGKMSLDLESIEPNTFLRACLALFDEVVERRDLRLHFDAMPTKGRVLVDARKLRQIVYNLLSNAVKFTPNGGDIRLSVRLVNRGAPWHAAPPDTVARVLPLPEASDGNLDLLEILVTDSGRGMRGEDLPQLFEAFQQLHSPEQAEHVGTGLGLALVSRFAALHGGTVGVASAPGRGSQFGVWLPWRHGDAPARTVLPELAAILPRRSATTRHALVIEDDPEAAELLRLHLEGAGFHVRVATNGNQLQRLGAPTPDLITLDILMPGTSGWEILEQIKRDETLACVPVVIVSMVADRQRGVALGASQVLEKPIGRQQLLNAVRSLGLPTHPGPHKVLVVDDDPVAIDLVASNLTGADCEVLRAHDGEQAIGIALSNQPDLIILDLMMPGLSGFEVLDRVRSQPAMASVPILVMTSKTITAQDRARLSGRVQQVVGKQMLDRDRFMAEVDRALHTETQRV
ncbi:MAG TPA: response regulator [Ideonella sp.]|uniref:response regulator n=1 Tax=Ideonella sp. TaxID=1929293 RepID=UPI002E337C35|nr:response regulator [Ideonella sp.]HEX5686086.1 response regulator [Ideonella sp.]